VLFVDEPGLGMTAIVRIHVAQTAQPFAWLIPSRGRPRMSLSSSVVLRRLSEATLPEHLLEVQVSGSCKADPDTVAAPPNAPPAERSFRLEGDPTWLDLAGLASGDTESVVARWLTSKGLSPGVVDQEALAKLARDGFGLFALHLAPPENANAEYTPTIALSYEAERPLLPLRLARTSDANELDLRVWVVGPSQAVPVGAPSLVLNEARIDWSSGVTYVAGTVPANGSGLPASEIREPANYAALVRAASAEAGGAGFVTELATSVSQIRQSVWSKTDEARILQLTHQEHGGATEVAAAARDILGDWDDTVGVASTRDGDAFLRLLRTRVVQPITDAAESLRKAPYLTRFRGVIAPEKLKSDVTFDYNPELAQVAKARFAHERLFCEGAKTRRDASWQIDLPHGGSVAGRGPGTPASVEATPANLRVVMLSTKGAGTVVKDNRATIESQLVRNDDADRALPPRLGALIGGDRAVTPPEPVPSSPPKATAPARATSRCSVGPRSGSGSGAIAAASVLIVALLLRRRRRVGALIIVFGALPGCTGHAVREEPSATQPPVPSASAVHVNAPPDTPAAERLQDPKSCKTCHPMHYREWSSSMHAYASDDPVFVAMNARGQRETGGKLGDFCLRCHAPMAARHGTTDSHTDPRALPDAQRGVTCYFCHNVTAVEGTHNGQLRIAGDTTMRGPIKDPAQIPVHGTEYSEFFNPYRPESTSMCGGCHDIVTPNGVELERTFREYRHGIFSKSATGEPPAFDSCVGCHMPGDPGFAATGKGLPQRLVHRHLWPAVDVALTDFPHRDAMRGAVERCELPTSISFFTLEVTPPDLFTFQIETNAGHNQPSGAAQDRRLWLEVSAYDAKGNLLENVSSGRITDGALEEYPPGDPKHDPNLLLLADRIFDVRGKPVHMFWEAEKSPQHPDGFESNLLPGANVTYLPGRHAIVKQYRISGPEGLPARVTARLRLRPIGMDVLQDLVASGDLDEALLAQMPTLDFGHRLEWTPKKGLMRPISATLAKANCAEYKCLLDPTSKYCALSAAPAPDTAKPPGAAPLPYGY
jgi:hypothetical protein